MKLLLRKYLLLQRIRFENDVFLSEICLNSSFEKPRKFFIKNDYKQCSMLLFITSLFLKFKSYLNFYML